VREVALEHETRPCTCIKNW